MYREGLVVRSLPHIVTYEKVFHFREKRQTGVLGDFPCFSLQPLQPLPSPLFLKNDNEI